MKFFLLPLVFFLFYSNCSDLSKLQNNEIDFDSVDFSLIDLSNKEFDFIESIKSKELTVIFFGYSHCPDICSNTLTEFSKAIEKLSYSQMKKTQFIFISVDTFADSNNRLILFSKNFDPRIIFLRGTESKIEKIKKDFKLMVVLDIEKNIDGSSKIIHSTNIFWLDKNKKKIKAFPHTMSGNEILREINKGELK